MCSRRSTDVPTFFRIRNYSHRRTGVYTYEDDEILTVGRRPSVEVLGRLKVSHLFLFSCPFLRQLLFLDEVHLLWSHVR